VAPAAGVYRQSDHGPSAVLAPRSRVGLIGSKAVEAVGRNPGAFGNILTLGIIAMALAEGLGIIAYLGGFGELIRQHFWRRVHVGLVALLHLNFFSRSDPWKRSSNSLAIAWPKLIAQVLIFCGVYFILNKKAFGPILAMLEQRKQRIADGEAKLDKIAKDLAEAEANAKAILDKANTDADPSGEGSW